jgi:hypothetical protein
MPRRKISFSPFLEAAIMVEGIADLPEVVGLADFVVAGGAVFNRIYEFFVLLRELHPMFHRLCQDDNSKGDKKNPYHFFFAR